MQYVIEVDEKLNDILKTAANARNMPVPVIITEMLKRFALDPHIMEQDDMWKNGIDECATVNLDWANL